MSSILKKIDRLNRDAYSLVYTDIKKANNLLKEAKELSSQENYTAGIAWSLMVSGLLEMEQGNLEQSSGQIDQAYHIFIGLNNDLNGLTAALNAMGLVCLRQSRMKESFKYLHKALDAARKNDMKDMEFRAVNLLGILQFKMENYSQALRFFTKALKLITKEKQSFILNNLGCTYRALGDYDQALKYLRKALEESKKKGFKDSTIPILEEIGLTYGKMEENDLGIEMLEKALNLCTKFHKQYKLSINIKLGELYLKKEQYDKAEEVLNKARDYINFSNSVGNRELYLFLSVLSEIKGNYKSALIHYKNFHMLSGKVKSTEIDEKVWEMETESFREVNDRIRQISEMGRTLTAQLDREAIIQALYQSINSIFEVDFYVLALNQVEGMHTITLKIYDNSGREIESTEQEISHPVNPESWVGIHRTGLIFNEMYEDYLSYFSSMQISDALKSMSSVLCLPFDSGEEKGVISLYKAKPESFNREDYEILEMLTSYTSIALSNARQTEIIRQKNKELEKLNKFDGLTGIYNKRHLQKEMEKSLKLCRRTGHYLHIMLIDVDYFKQINDTLGHNAGDFALKSLGQLLTKLLNRSSDIYGRFGGEEFVVALQDIPLTEARNMAEKIRLTVEQEEISWEDKNFNMTVSIGLCSAKLAENEAVESIQLIGEADKNMYTSKAKGRNRITYSVL